MRTAVVLAFVATAGILLGALDVGDAHGNNLMIYGVVNSTFTHIEAAGYDGFQQQCDDVLVDCGPQVRTPEDPPYSEKRAILVGNADDEVEIHINCILDIENPTFAGAMRVRARVFDGDDDVELWTDDGPIYCYEEYTTDTDTNDVVVNHIDWTKPGPYVTDPSLPMDGMEFQVWYDDPTEARPSELLSHLSSIGHIWITGLAGTQVARLVDPSEEDYYIVVTGDEYELLDPSGDDQLYINNNLVAMYDSIPVSAGDVQITRVLDPELGLTARRWLLLNVQGEVLTARIAAEGGDFVTRIRTYT